MAETSHPDRTDLHHYTSDELEVGQVYTRDELRHQFKITDQTLYTGIFQPPGTHSIWLFLTEQKSPDRTQYSDRLEGDRLSWQGQTQGRKDQLIIEHASHALEVLVFYRKEKTQYGPGAGFRYEGRFCYVSHTGAHPTSFVLQRVEALLTESIRNLSAQERESDLVYREGKSGAAIGYGG